MTSELIRRDTVTEIVAHRDQALHFYRLALESIEDAHDSMRCARQAVDAACGGATTGETYSSYVDQKRAEIEAFNAALGPQPDAHDFAEGARRLTDTRVWASLVERTNLDALMDKQAKSELRRQMGAPQERRQFCNEIARGDEESNELPHVTEENIRETLAGFQRQAGLIFRRGLANAFASLDRRFRSHDGFKIGSRIIFDRAFDEWGHWSYYRGTRDTIQDVERVFRVLGGGKPAAPYAGIVGVVDTERKGLSRQQSEHEGDYFKVRIFKNGNAHLWFTRPDLVDKANGLLAEYYGDALGEGKDTPEDPTAPLENQLVGYARNLGYFPTPPAVVERVMEQANWEPGMEVLEPSAGEGALARWLIDYGLTRIDCFELDAERVEKLRADDIYRAVAQADFLKLEPRACYDRVVMNPPFDRGRDVDHVWHAWKFLRPGGRLVAVMSASTEFRSDKKTTVFRDHMNAAGARWTDLPAGSFAPRTQVNTLILAVTKS